MVRHSLRRMGGECFQIGFARADSRRSAPRQFPFQRRDKLHGQNHGCHARMQVRVNEARQDDFVLKGRVDFVRKSLKPWVKLSSVPTSRMVPSRTAIACPTGWLGSIVWILRAVYTMRLLMISPPRPAPMFSCCFIVAKRGNLSAFY